MIEELNLTPLQSFILILVLIPSIYFLWRVDSKKTPVQTIKKPNRDDIVASRYGAVMQIKNQ